MEISIHKQNENKMLHRKEIHFTASYSGKTPSREELKVELCKKLNLDPDKTIIVKASQLYGVTSSDVLAYAYESNEAMNTVPDYITKRGASKDAKDQAAAKPDEGTEAAKPNKNEAPEGGDNK